MNTIQNITKKLIGPSCLLLTIMAWRGLTPTAPTLSNDELQSKPPYNISLATPPFTSEPRKISYDIDEFIKKEINLSKKETNFHPDKLNNLVTKVIDDPIFKYLNQNFVKKNHSLNDSFFQKYYNQEQLFKMQKLTKYISNKYSISITQSEEIIYNTFLQSHEQNLNPLLLLSIISIESTFKPNSQSEAGAIGLTQVMPKYHQSKIKKLNNPKEDLWSIDGNIQVGAEVLKEYLVLSKYNLRNALHRYNGSYGDTSNKYSKKVLNKLNQYELVFNS